jgi:hypothetical protein
MERVYTFRRQGVDHFLAVRLGEDGESLALLSWRMWALLEPSR